MKPKDLVRKKLAAYRGVFGGPDGQTVLDDLKSQFNGTSLRKVNGLIDANASIAAAGCREVVLYIEQMLRIEVDAVD